jgi:hypothetical protein
MGSGSFISEIPLYLANIHIFLKPPFSMEAVDRCKKPRYVCALCDTALLQENLAHKKQRPSRTL